MSKIIINGKSDGALKAYVNGQEINGVMAGGGKAYTRMETSAAPVPPVGPRYLCFTAEQANSTVSFSPALRLSVTLYRSSDGENWTSWDGATVTLASVGDKLYVYGENDTLYNGGYYSQFSMTGSIAASGDLTTLLTQPGTDTVPGSCFRSLFEGCTILTTAPDLPATTLENYCYSNMFYGCTAITAAPELPATTLADGCYQGMFYGCTSLASAPELPATTLANGCYWDMFNGCTSLATAPALPATTLANNCYNSMFLGCTSLTTAPELPATTLVNNCYKYMFQGCRSLSSVKVGATTWNTSSANQWLKSVASSGTIYAPTGSQIARYSNTASGVPSRWTVSYY